MSRTAITLKFKLRWFPEEAGYSAEKGYTDINLPPLVSNEDKNISRLDHQPLFGKGARAPPPKFSSGRDADQTRESGGNRA